MKRIVIFILTLLYLGTTSGATVHFHYCMGKLVAWSFSHASQKHCFHCGMIKVDNGNDCCQDQHKQVKIEKDQTITEISGKSLQLFPLFIVTEYAHLSGNGYVVALDCPVAHAPPFFGNIAIHTRNCVFRI